MILSLAALAFAADEPTQAPSTGVAVEVGPAAATPEKPAKKPTPPPPMGGLPEHLLQAARDARNLPLAERVRAVSDPLVGTPYLRDPLGEGSGHDPDPYARYDAFDCLTFVEEVVALALAPDPVHASDVRLGLRYGESDTDPTYADRNHFMELQWIPRAVANGYMRDTTREYGRTFRHQREVNQDTWTTWARRKFFPIPDDKLPNGTMGLDVLGFDEAKAAVDRIRPGSMIMTVRNDKPGVPLWISHVGITVPNERRPTMRHATNMSKRKNVKDNSLAWYIDHIATYPKWPASGISILEPVEYGPRISLLPSE